MRYAPQVVICSKLEIVLFHKCTMYAVANGERRAYISLIAARCGRERQMFYIAVKMGFVTDDDAFTANVRWARPFESFKAADEFAKANLWIGTYYAVLRAA